MFVCVKHPRAILFLASLYAISVFGLNSSHTQTIVCCDVWRAVSAFTVEKTGSRMSFQQCVKPNECIENKLIKQFLAQSQRLLNQKLEFDDNAQILVQPNEWSADVITSLLAWAFVGRVVSGHQDDENSLAIVYDFQTDKLSLKRTVCEFDRSIYTSMVLISVSLLTYFIVDRVVKQQASQELTQNVLISTEHASGVMLQPTAAAIQAFTFNTPHAYSRIRNKTNNLI